MITDEPELVVIDTDGQADAWLVLADSFMPGWSADIDGVAAPILAADLAFRAVAVPAGPHRVTFRYDAPGWALGRIGGLLGLLGAVALALRAWSERRSPGPEARPRTG